MPLLQGNGATDPALGEDSCTHSSSYLGVRLSQRCSCVHQKLAHGPVPLAGCLVQRGLTPKSKMKWVKGCRREWGRGEGGREGSEGCILPLLLTFCAPWPLSHLCCRAWIGEVADGAPESTLSWSSSHHDI